MKAKKILTLAAVAVLSVGLVACGAKKDSSNDKKIVIGATPNPHAEILNEVVKPILEKDGYELEVKVFNDYVLPNEALLDKSLDANFFQHVPYMEEYNAKNKTDITYTVKVHLEPMGVYSDKVKNILDVKDGGIVAVPNDPTNESRALKILEKEGLIKLTEGKELLNKNDIVENKKNLVIKELVAEQLPTALKDVDLDVINSNYALQAKLNPTKDAIAIESKDSPYANIISVRTDNKDSEKIKALSKAITSPEVKKFIEEKYAGAIIPSF
ncbi:MetQ/NlpA family ABC transporter substrate-binding protein [Peptostreptococcus canis]|uniref:Lipoprotein n=1 Tax=Peptostreptococcus canis TaxID=1159213 RepID=A0ABR6TKR0_9FIRM|nr:MetQ/NlpA family ABC transporter substrate-binding protein [Peptostreptococcus canis]MBC2575828.1 MetQ/NlpA family ABC transporter substrate-binding protein [Peptostreptococcus canis]MBP1998055.1 D-methionine transport system substrate-binding protein [Peptostreptococcus canis]